MLHTHDTTGFLSCPPGLLPSKGWQDVVTPGVQVTKFLSCPPDLLLGELGQPAHAHPGLHILKLAAEHLSLPGPSAGMLHNLPQGTNQDAEEDHACQHHHCGHTLYHTAPVSAQKQYTKENRYIHMRVQSLQGSLCSTTSPAHSRAVLMSRLLIASRLYQPEPGRYQLCLTLMLSAIQQASSLHSMVCTHAWCYHVMLLWVSYYVYVTCACHHCIFKACNLLYTVMFP